MKEKFDLMVDKDAMQSLFYAPDFQAYKEFEISGLLNSTASITICLPKVLRKIDIILNRAPAPIAFFKIPLVFLYTCFFILQIKRHRIQDVVITRDRTADASILGLRVAAKISSVITTLCVLTLPSDGVKMRLKGSRYRLEKRFAKRLHALILSENMLESANTTIIWFRNHDALLWRLLFGKNINPWLIGHSVDKVYLYNSDFRKYLPSPPQCIVEEKSLSLPRKEKIKNRAVFSLPAWFEHGWLSFDECVTIFNTIISSLAESGFSVIASLHPKMDHFKYTESIETELCKIVSTPITELIASAEVFICGRSTTAFFAEEYKIPIFILNRSKNDECWQPEGAFRFNVSEYASIGLKARRIVNSRR